MGANFQIVAGFADLGGDGTGDLIVLQDRLNNGPTQTLAVYRLENKIFRLVAQAVLPPQRIAYLVWGIRDSLHGKQILVRTATQGKCDAGGDPQAAGTFEVPFLLQGDRLQPDRPVRRDF